MKHTREGKPQHSLGKNKDNESFSIFNNIASKPQKERKEYTKKQAPLFSVEQRNQMLRNLNNGVNEEILGRTG